MSNNDRTVHGLSRSGAEIVHYDRAGKWYLEPKDGKRTLIGVHEAARQAFLGASVLGKPGGMQFDAKVRKMQKESAA